MFVFALFNGFWEQKDLLAGIRSQRAGTHEPCVTFHTETFTKYVNNMFTSSKQNIQQIMTTLVMLMVMCADFKIAVKEQQNDTDEKAFVTSL